MLVRPPEQPTGKRALRKQDRRQAIVDAARQSFLENGYAATSMSGLLKTLGGSKATLWSYFRSKEELFAAVVEDVTAAFRLELQDVLLSSGALRPTLTGFCLSLMHKMFSPDAIATWRLIVAESGRFPEVGQIFYDRAPRTTYAALGEFLNHHIAAGHLRDEDPMMMAETLISLCCGQQNRLLWGIGSPSAEEIERSAADFTRLFLRAYAV